MAEELWKLLKPHIMKVYSPFGQTPDDGHNFVTRLSLNGKRTFLDSSMRNVKR